MTEGVLPTTRTRFDHERLDVYKTGMEFLRFIATLMRKAPRMDRRVSDHLIRAGLSITQNIAEGNGKRSMADRKRYWEIARGSAMECAATLDAHLAFSGCPTSEVEPGKALLHRIVQMLSKMTAPLESVAMETEAEYRTFDGVEKPIQRRSRPALKQAVAVPRARARARARAR